MSVVGLVVVSYTMPLRMALGQVASLLAQAYLIFVGAPKGLPACPPKTPSGWECVLLLLLSSISTRPYCQYLPLRVVLLLSDRRSSGCCKGPT